MLLVFSLVVSTVQYSCQSKVKQATKDVQNEYKDVVQAKEKGAEPDKIQEERQELNQARQDYVETWEEERNKIKDEINEGVQRIDQSIARLEQDMQKADANARDKYLKSISDLRQERNQLESRSKDVIAATQATWSNTKRQIRRDIDASKDRINRLVGDAR
ncbi:hypothetical protein GCM10023189_28580 [Nibrella saemangeumensis]|uniref:Uncharacterized protein n=2 Tax=Nibrella saemangeumensis TaxID=1084526 RepID=A0ABP8N117_9BACT